MLVLYCCCCFWVIVVVLMGHFLRWCWSCFHCTWTFFRRSFLLLFHAIPWSLFAFRRMAIKFPFAREYFFFYSSIYRSECVCNLSVFVRVTSLLVTWTRCVLSQNNQTQAIVNWYVHSMCTIFYNIQVFCLSTCDSSLIHCAPSPNIKFLVSFTESRECVSLICHNQYTKSHAIYWSASNLVSI